MKIKVSNKKLLLLKKVFDYFQQMNLYQQIE